MKTKNKVTAIVFAAMLIFSALMLIGAQGLAEESLSDGFVAELTAKEDTLPLIDESGKSDYNIIFSSDAIQLDYSLSKEIQTLFAEKGVLTVGINPDIYVAEHATHEILIGMTNRAESEELLAKLEDACKNSDDIAWGYAVINEKLLFVANSAIAFELGQDKFIEYLTECELIVPKTLCDINTMTQEEYEAKLEAEKEAARQKRIEEVIKMNAEFTQADFGGDPQEMPKGLYDRPDTYPAKDQHPRLFLAGADLSEIYDVFLNDPNMETARLKILEYANSEDFTGIFPEKTGASGEIYRFTSTILAQMEARAFMYLLTGDELYGYEAIVGAKNAMITLHYTTDLHMDVYHGASQTMVNVAKVYDWCYDLLTEDDKNQIIAGVSNILGPQMESGMRFPPSGMNGISGHGTGPQFIRDWMTVAIVFYDEMPSWWDFVGGRYYQEYVPVIQAISENGWASQGTVTYGDSKYFTRSWAAWLVKTTTGEMPYIDDFHLCAYYYFSHIQPNGKYFQTGDGNRSADGCTIGDSCAYMFISAALYQDPTIAAMAKYYSDDYTRFSYAFTTEMTAPDMIIFYTLGPTVDEEPTEKIDAIQYFEAPAASMTARTDWSKDAAAVLMRIGTMTLANHDLYDHGTFQIYYKGLLAGTSGSYRHYASYVHEYYLQATVGHNGLLVFDPDLADAEPLYGTNADGTPNTAVITNHARYYYSGSQVSRSSPGSFEEWLSGSYEMGTLLGAAWSYNGDGTPAYAYIGGDITKSYDEKTVSYVGRKMLTVFTGDEAMPILFFTYDQITSKEEDHVKSFLLHTVKEPVVDTEKLTAEIVEGEGRLMLHSLSGADAITSIGGHDKAWWINGKNCVDEYVKDADLDVMWGRVELTATGALETSMLSAMYVTDATSDATLEFKTGSNDTVEYTQVLDKVIVFTKTTADSYYKEFSFDTEGKGLYNYYVAGVEMGTWRVKVDGVFVATVVSEENGAFVSFVAPAGEVTLIPGSDVLGGNGGRIKYSLGGGRVEGDYPVVYRNDVATPLPTNLTKPESFFLGWYTTPTFDEGTSITEIPIGTVGTVNIYAKWLNNIVNVNYNEMSKVVNVTSGRPSVNGINYNTNNGEGCSFLTTTDSERTKYLEWTKGAASSFMTTSSSTNNYATMNAEDECASFTVVLSKKAGADPISTLFRIYTKSTMSGVTSDSTITRQVIFSTNENGEVRLGDSGAGPVAAILSENKTTLRIVLDFKNEELRAYDDIGNVTARTPVTAKALSEAKNMSEWRTLLTSILYYWIATGGGADAAFNVYSIKIDEGDRFSGLEPADGMIVYDSGAGGIVPSDAPRYYSSDKPTKLPIPQAAGGSIFAGWYTSPDFDPDTLVTEIPADQTGVAYVYAKWSIVILDEDYSETEINNTTGDATRKDVLYRLNQSTGGSFITKTDPDTGKKYLEWKEGAADTNPFVVRNTGSIAALSDHQISYEFSFSKNGDAPLPTFYMRTLAQYDLAGNKLSSSNSLPLFKVAADGIYLASDLAASASAKDVKISDITDGIMTVRVVLDFAKLTVFAYDDMGNVYQRPFTVPESSGAKDGIEFQKTFTTYDFYMMTTTPKSVTDAEVRIHSIKLASGNIFTNTGALDGIISYITGGAALPEDAPSNYLPDAETPLPIPTKNGSLFVGWYTTPDFRKGSEVTAIPAGTKGIFTVYARWIDCIFSEDYSDIDIEVAESNTKNINGVTYNAGSSGEPKPGSTFTTVTDEGGNKYLRVMAEAKNSCIAITNSSYNLTHFDETAISYEFSLAKDEELPMASVQGLITTSSANFGRLYLYTVDGDGNVRLEGSDKVVATLSEEFTTVRMTIDFATATLTAYGESGDPLDTVRLSVPAAKDPTKQPETLLDWQKVASNYIFYMNITKGSAESQVALEFDNLKIYEGRAFGEAQAEIAPANGIRYETNGGILPEGTSTDYVEGAATPLAIPTRNGFTFAGWYTDESFASETLVTEAPLGATGEFAVYAKWLKTIVLEDYSESEVDITEKSSSKNGVNYNGGNASSGDLKPGASFKTEKDADGNGYLVWTKGEKDPIIHVNNGAMAKSRETVFSYEFTFSKNGDSPVMATTMRTMAQYDKDGVKLATSAKIFLFGTTNSGNVYLARNQSVSLGTVPTDGSSFTARVVIDFDALKIYGYLDDGTVVSEDITIPSETGATTGEEYAALFTTYVLCWQGVSGTDATATLRVDSIKVTAGNVFA